MALSPKELLMRDEYQIPLVADPKPSFSSGSSPQVTHPQTFVILFIILLDNSVCRNWLLVQESKDSSGGRSTPLSRRILRHITR